MKTCHICGYCLWDHECRSCGHAECPKCSAMVDRKSYQEMEAERDALKVTLAARESMLDRLNASNERLNMENAALRKYSKLCEMHTSDCERGHLKSATCVRCLLTLATSLRCKAEAERDALKLKLQRICEPVSDEEWGFNECNYPSAKVRQMLKGARELFDNLLAARAAKE